METSKKSYLCYRLAERKVLIKNFKNFGTLKIDGPDMIPTTLGKYCRKMKYVKKVFDIGLLDKDTIKKLSKMLKSLNPLKNDSISRKRSDIPNLKSLNSLILDINDWKERKNQIMILNYMKISRRIKHIALKGNFEVLSKKFTSRIKRYLDGMVNLKSIAIFSGNQNHYENIRCIRQMLFKNWSKVKHFDYIGLSKFCYIHNYPLLKKLGSAESVVLNLYPHHLKASKLELNYLKHLKSTKQMKIIIQSYSVQELSDDFPFIYINPGLQVLEVNIKNPQISHSNSDFKNFFSLNKLISNLNDIKSLIFSVQIQRNGVHLFLKTFQELCINMKKNLETLKFEIISDEIPSEKFCSLEFQEILANLQSIKDLTLEMPLLYNNLKAQQNLKQIFDFSKLRIKNKLSSQFTKLLFFINPLSLKILKIDNPLKNFQNSIKILYEFIHKAKNLYCLEVKRETTELTLAEILKFILTAINNLNKLELCNIMHTSSAKYIQNINPLKDYFTQDFTNISIKEFSITLRQTKTPYFRVTKALSKLYQFP